MSRRAYMNFALIAVFCIAAFLLGAAVLYLALRVSIALKNKENKVEPRAAPEKTKTMDVILIIMGIATLIFTIAMIWIFVKTGAIPDTLCNCFFAFVGGECGVMGWIQTNKKKYNNTEKDDEEAKG